MKDKKEKLKHKKLENRVGDVVGDIIGVIVTVLVAIYLLPKLPFVDGSRYAVYLPISIVAAVVHSTFDLIRHLSPKKIGLLFRSLASLPSLYSIYKLVEIRPFDFALINKEWLNAPIYLAFYVVIFALVLAFVIEMFEFITFTETKEKE